MKKVEFVDCWDIVENSYPNFFFYIFCGGRGLGKTYSCLKGLKNIEGKFMYIRRTETEMKNCCQEEFNPYKTLCIDFEWDIHFKKSGDNALILENADDENVNLLGYASCLTTFGKYRGADFSDVDYILFDEFINLSPVDKVKNSASLLFNLIETVNRDREFFGQPPVKVILLSNANTIQDDIIRTLKLGDVIYKIKNREINSEYTDENRGLYFSLIKTPPSFYDAKAETALYKLTKGTSFYEMALNNEFVTDYFGDIKKFNYAEFEPMCAYENVYFYKHKSKRLYFASYRKHTVNKYTKWNFEKFKRDYGMYMMYIIENGYMLYLDYDVKMEVLNIWN